MPKRVPRRLPDVRSLYETLPRGSEGGKEFARIVDLLLFHEARREGRKISIFSDSAGDFYGLDSFEGDVFRKEGTTGYQYKFYPSPLSPTHRQAIIKSLKKTAEQQKEIKLKKWILVTPQDLTESSTRKDAGDVSWFESLRSQLKLKFQIEHWGHKKLLGFFLQSPSLCLFYYPELTTDASSRRTIEDTRRRYNDNVVTLYRNIEFVGMSVYKQEATKGVPMEHIYIPLTVVPEAADVHDNTVARINPLRFLEPTAKRVILGDPGSGKSTLVRFLALVGNSRALQKRCQAKPDRRLPILITLRRYADELRTRRQLSLIDYMQECIQGDFNLKSADLDFFEYYLETGQAILLFDGLDELPNPNFKQIVRDRIRTLVTTYPGNTVLVTTRIVGYDSAFRFSEKEFSHFRLTKLQLDEMESFVTDWYHARIENPQEREANAKDLVRILRNDDNLAIRELAENPLLLTIVALVHRIDAVLPDERVVLYQKCTETLLNTWHTWKYREAEVKNRGREERRNRRRMEAIANWMHGQSIGTSKDQRAVVPYDSLSSFLSTYISDIEGPYDPDNDPQDIATEFLEFVKKKAGLLVEVGDQKYSFVHQTFQEYLTASHIIASNEVRGVDGIWEDISEYCGDPRWLEVIRLLIAGLQSTGGQQMLIDKVLSLKLSSQKTSRPELLGGLLLDGVEPAELHSNEIIEELVRAASGSVDANKFRRLLAILRTWLSREQTGNPMTKECFERLHAEAKTANQKLRLILLATALAWSDSFASELSNASSLGSKHGELLNALVLRQSDRISFRQFSAEYKRLWNLQDIFSLTSPYTNFVAAICQSLTHLLEPEFATKRAFEEQLMLLSMGPSYGPFTDYNFNTLSISCSTTSCKRSSIATPHFDSPRRSLHESPKLTAMLEILKPIVRNRVSTIEIATRRVNQLVKGEEEMKLLLAHRINRDGASIIPRDLNVHERLWSNVLSSPKLCGHIVDTIAIAFKLEPRALWSEALRATFLPIVPERLNVIFDQNQIHMLESRIAEEPLSAENVFRAAHLLLFDCWLYVMDFHDSPIRSPMKKIAQLARRHDIPALRIATVVRDLFYGNHSRVSTLHAMLESNDPEYRSIFKSGYWRRTEWSRRQTLKKRVSKKR